MVATACALTVCDGCSWWVVSAADNDGVSQLVKCHERRLGCRRGTLGAGVGCNGRIGHRGQFNHGRWLVVGSAVKMIAIDHVFIGRLAFGNWRWTDGIGRDFNRTRCHRFKCWMLVVIHHFTVFRLARKQDLHTWCSTFSITLRLWLEIHKKKREKKRRNKTNTNEIFDQNEEKTQKKKIIKWNNSRCSRYEWHVTITDTRKHYFFSRIARNDLLLQRNKKRLRISNGLWDATIDTRAYRYSMINHFSNPFFFPKARCKSVMNDDGSPIFL